MALNLKKLKLSTKLLVLFSVSLVAFVAATTFLFVRAYREDAVRALSGKSAAFTAVADEAKTFASESMQSGAVDVETLLAEAVEAIDNGHSYRDTRFFNAIPVVVGWTTAQRAAEKENIEFRVTAFEARNKKNEPAPGTFRHTMLAELESQIAAGGPPTLSKINEETNTMHYMRAVGLDQSCMACHGDPLVYDKDGDGKDPLGFPMEGWEVGDTHGAYEVMAPLAVVDEQVAGFVGNALAIIGPAMIAVVGFLIYAMRTMLVKPLAHLADSMKNISTGDGDLTRRLALDRGDEIGEVAKWFDTLIHRVHEIIKEIGGAANEVAAAATEIATSNEEMSAGLADQQSQTESAASAVGELDQSVAGIARETTEALATAEKSREKATSGRDVVSDASREITAIAGEVNESATIVQQLGEKSEEIGGVIGVINEIAEQTNLLALNAAIEAARAGEHGRGFAVVADEVRKLAERTTTATDEVSRSIREIQEQTSLAATRIQEGAGRMDRGVELANHAGESLGEIVIGSGSLLEKVQSIAAAAEQQAVSATQISESIRNVTHVTNESVQAAEQAAQAANALSQQSEHLRALVSQFKV